VPADGSVWLVALTSIHWREAWKYGERAFRYCQHDLGHAIAAVRMAAALAGYDARLLPQWSHQDIATLTGIDRDHDYVEAEREEPGCVMEISRQAAVISRDPLLAAVRQGTWTGRANQLSEDHVTWSVIDDVARATRDPGRGVGAPTDPAPPAPPAYSAALILQRRSAVSFDPRGSLNAAQFFTMLARVMPQGDAPWDALWWEARIHFVLFVHRVTGLAPGLYLLARDADAIDRLRRCCGREFLWEQVHETLPCFALARGDCRALARRVSCDQDIAADGFFSLGMIAEFDASLDAFGPSFYRHLFWESGVVGQVLYLEAEAAGVRATGIGCFYDDPVHEVLGLTGHAFQSLYHFTVGQPVEDTRLTTEPGYSWVGGAG
jgi:nitroreductase